MTQPDFTEFVEQRQRSLLRFAMVLCGDARLAEDLVADVLGRAYEKWARVSAVDAPYAYVRRMLVNHYLSWQRRAVRSTPHADVTPFVAPVADHADAQVQRSALAADLARLPRRQRAVLVLRYYEGLADAEIAAALGCGESTVRSNASRALARLRIDLVPTAIAQEA